jgi:hypothetical protein
MVLCFFSLDDRKIVARVVPRGYDATSKEDDLKMKAFFGLFQPFRRQTSQTRTLSDVNR